MRQLSEVTFKRITALMQDMKPRSSVSLAEELRISICAASHALQALYAQKLIFIERYELGAKGSSYRRVFVLGSKPDAKKPRGTKNACLRREREWLEQSRATGSVIFRHPHDVALFGEYQRGAA